LISPDSPIVLKDETISIIQKKISERFPFMKEKYEENTLRVALGPSLFDRLNELYLSREEEKRRFRGMTRSGSIVEPRLTGWEGVVVYDDTKLPYSALRQGVVYPEGVDIKNREKYLSDDEFKRVLGFTKEEWKGMCRYKKIEHKKRVGLF